MGSGFLLRFGAYIVETYDRGMGWLADVCYLLAVIALLPRLAYDAVVLGKHRTGWRERFGHIAPLQGDQPCVWIHAVSLGEMNATRSIVKALSERLPDCRVVVSATTDTGFARGIELYGADMVIRYPLDFSWVVRRVLERVRPTMVVLMELEVWFNLVRECDRRGIPVAVINGRLTERSERRFGWIQRVAARMFGRLAWVGAQDESIARRFRKVGVPADRVSITSSLKWDTAQVADAVPGTGAVRAAMGIPANRPVWVCGSTGPAEEEVILDAYRRVLDGAESGAAQGLQGVKAQRSSEPPNVGVVVAVEGTDSPAGVGIGAPAGELSRPALVIVPRKPERFDEVAAKMETAGFVCVRRSRRPDGFGGASTEQPSGREAVFLGDTIGELRKFYSLADVVFVGRSLVPMGGSDPIEVAALGKPIVAGPHMENFEAAVADLKAAGALRTATTDGELASVVTELLSDAARRNKMGERARDVVLRNQGATQRTVSRLVDLFHEARRRGSR